MELKQKEKFRQDAAWIALTNGLTRKQIADDLGVGMPTLNKSITTHRRADVLSEEDLEPVKENDRLRHENCIFKEEREIQKRPPGSSRA